MKLIRDIGMEYATITSKQKTRFGLYECSICKKHFRTATKRVNHTKQESCHSCSASIRSKKHGGVGTRLYEKWSSMKQRCTNKNNPSYDNYGGRGITVSSEWSKYETFQTWAMLNGYKECLEIDRIDNDCGYSPSNCRFTTRSINTQNTRVIRKNNTSGYRGVSFDSTRDSWQVEIQVNNKRVYIGRFSNKIIGAEMYNKYIIDNNLEHPLNIV